MNQETYYQCIRTLVPSYGAMPTENKKLIVDYMKTHPDVKYEAATDKELAAIFNYLNHTSMDVDMDENMGFLRYKDAVLCINYEHTGWILLERRPDDQMWDFLHYLIDHDVDPEFCNSMSNIYAIK